MNKSLTLEQRVQRLEDVLEIANLKARYLNGADGGWTFNKLQSDADVIMPLFAEDGEWHSDSQGSAVGREAIREAWKKFSGVMPFAVHCISNPLIEVDGDEASGEWHLMMQGVDKNGVEFWSAGIYQDRFKRTPDGWRIASIRPRLIYLGPYQDGFAKLIEASNKGAQAGKMPGSWTKMHEGG